MNILIFAGGSGTRLWPASREKTPKQLLKFVGDKTLLQQTYNRMRKGVPAERIFIATSSAYERQILKQLPRFPKSHLSLEPVRKDRGPALGLAALIMDHHSPDSVFATAWSDDYIAAEDTYHTALKDAADYIIKHPNSLIALGATPTTAHTGFRYIALGKSITKQPHLAAVKRFSDKPNQKEAQKYLRSGKHLWNTGYFVTTTSHILTLYKRYAPQCYAVLQKIKPAIGTKQQQAVVNKLYSTIQAFDFESIFFKYPKELIASPITFDWADVGRWSVIKDIQSSKKDNLLHGLVLDHETGGSLVYNYNPKQLVTTLHVKDLIIVVTPEAVLVANKDNSEELKHLIDRIKQNPKLKKFL